MELQIQAVNSSSVSGSIDLSEKVFNQPLDKGLIHRVVVAYDAAGRQGTKAQKNRSDRRGGGAKPFRQKGTGRARAGTIRSPIWRGGGITFAATNRSFTQRMPKKMYRKAMSTIVSQLIREERLHCIEPIELAEPKTKAFLQVMGERVLNKTLILVSEVNENLALSSRNVPGVCVMLASRVDPRTLVLSNTVLATADALKQLEERFS